jgi:integrase
MLTMRQRGKARIFYIRGSVSFGAKRVDVAEYSSGTSDADAASQLMAEHEATLREELRFGPKAQLTSATIADAFAAYLIKANKPSSSDILRVGKMNEKIGGMPLSDPHSAWRLFREGDLANHRPAGQDRYRSVLQAAVNVYLADRGLAKIKIAAIKFKNERIRFLSPDERDLLISCYPPHVQPIILVLAFQGLRTQEALQLKWGLQGVDVESGTIWIEDTKTETVRLVPMHPRVREILMELWLAQGKPSSGSVFVNRLGKPYQDTRKAKIQGGNPLKSAHRTACRKAKIENFTVHDWRHHFASHCMMAGVDVESLRRMGGWANYRMIQRYAAVSSDHMRDSINKIG